MRLVLFAALFSMNYGVGCECLPRGTPSHQTDGGDADAGAVVAVVLAPAGGEVWAGGSTHTLEWSGGGPASRTTLEASFDDGVTWSAVAANVSGSTFDWQLPTVDSEQCRIRASIDGVSASSPPFTIDSTAPVVTLLRPDSGVLLTPGTMENVSWTATDRALAALPITLEASSNAGATWSLLSSAEPNDGDALIAVPATETPTARVRVSAVDLAGNVGTASSGDFTVDATPPVFQPAQFSINAGATSTLSQFIRVVFVVTDDGSPINAVCLKYDNATQPAASDPCWQAVPPTASYTAALDFRLGFAPRAYPLFAWARNLAGLTSSLSNAGAGTAGTDTASITFAPVTPPDVTRVVASSIAGGAGPTLPAGSTVFIRWRAVSNGTLNPNPISLSYTTDDVTFTPIASNLANAADSGGCALTAGDTGCFTWTNGSPTSSYFRVRVGAVDNTHRQTWRSTAPLNVANVLRVLAGSTDPGTEGSAESAVFITQNVSVPYASPNSLIVSDSGLIYFNDANRGLLRVDPADGVQHLLIRRTGSLLDGPVATATMRNPSRIAFDSQQRVLILDDNVIRRYDPVAGDVTTVIGGGTDHSAVVAPRALAIISVPATAVSELFFATPDGKIYFQSEGSDRTLTPSTGFTLRVYDPSANAGAGEVRTLSFSGIGDSMSPTQDITLCRGYSMAASFEPTTGLLTSIVLGLGHQTAGCPSPNGDSAWAVFDRTPTLNPPNPSVLFDGFASFTVGQNGGLYQLSRRSSIIQRFDPVTHMLSPVVGTGINGTCADGTPALSCNIDPSDITVTRSGQLYFVDRGLVRTLDQSGAVYTLMGQSLWAGDGQEAPFARLGEPFDVKLWNNGGTPTVIFYDGTQFRLREFPIGGVIQTIAGTGTHGIPNLTAPAAGQSLSYTENGTINERSFQVHPTLGTVFTSRTSPRFSKFERTTGLWSDIAGGGAVLYPLTANTPGANVDFFSSYAPKAIGFDGVSKVLLHKHRYINFGYEDAQLLTIDITSSGNPVTPLAGVTGVSATSLCADGVSRSACNITYQSMSATYDTLGARWLLLNSSEATLVRAFPVAAGPVSTVATLSRSAVSIALRHTATVNYLYVCRDTGVLAVVDLTAHTESALPWPIARMHCTGRNLLYDPVRSSVIFPFTLDGVGGIGEYFTP